MCENSYMCFSMCVHTRANVCVHTLAWTCIRNYVYACTSMNTTISECMCMSVYTEIRMFGAMAKFIPTPIQCRSKAHIDSGASEKNTHPEPGRKPAK